jgi:hypothetical protein
MANQRHHHRGVNTENTDSDSQKATTATPKLMATTAIATDKQEATNPTCYDRPSVNGDYAGDLARSLGPCTVVGYNHTGDNR